MLNLVACLPLALHCLLPDAGACRRVVHQRQLRIRSCAEPPLPPPKPSDSERAAEPEERTYSDDWSGAGRFADEDPLPLSFWLLGPNPRRTLLPALLIPLLVGPATNLWGSGSLLLSLAPEAARKQRLDTFYPVSNRKGYPYDKGYLDYSAGSTRYYDEDGRYEFRYPASYVRDRAVYLRNVDAAYQRRMMATTGLPGSSTAKPRGPEVAFGPADGTGTRDENLSVVVAAIDRGFTLRGVLGSPTEAAERLLRETIGRQARACPPSTTPATTTTTTPRAHRPPSASGAGRGGADLLIYVCVCNTQAVVEQTTLLGASERTSASSGKPLYQFEYRVDYVNAQQPPSYTVCVVGASRDTLYTFASRVPEKVWKENAEQLREAASSFVLY